MSKLYVVGIGPGGYEQMTVKAVKVLEECDIIVGYTVYVDLVAEHFAGKEMLTTPMRQEEKRCRMAFDEVMPRNRKLKQTRCGRLPTSEFGKSPYNKSAIE